MLTDSLKNHVTAKLVVNPVLWMGVGLCLVILVPIVSIAPWLQTFIHPWRPELAASLLALGPLFWASRSSEFGRFLTKISGAELFTVLLPCTAFILWSAVSIFYAGSPRSVIHHTALWAIYLVLYIFLRFFSEKRADARILIAAVIAAVWMIGLPAVFEYYTIVNAQDITTIGLRYAKYAEMLNTLFPLVVVFTLREKGKVFWFGIATSTLLGLFAIASLSRTAAGLLVIGAAMIALAIFALERFRPYRKRFSILAVILVVTPILLHTPSFFSSAELPLVNRMKREATDESTNVRPFFSKIALEMLNKNPLTGVGADNYGQEFSRYRGLYAETHPGDPNLALVEAEMPERAHNEFSQIGAELGLPGLAIIGWFLVGISSLFIFAFLRRKNISLPTLGALVGIVLFLASSLVTSYSFRIPQNGLVFFFVLALAVNGTLRKGSTVKVEKTPRLDPWLLRAGLATGILCCLGLAAFSISRAASVVYGFRGAEAAANDEAARAFDISFALDGDNGSNYFVRGMRLFREEKYAEAIPFIRRAIDLGRATSIEYSYLSSAQILAQEKTAAEKTLAEAVRTYPLSVALRTKYAALLSDTGKKDAALEQFAKARQIDARQAETWRNLIERGAVVASKTAFAEKQLPVMDLKPKQGIYAILAEREALYPEERSKKGLE